MTALRTIDSDVARLAAVFCAEMRRALTPAEMDSAVARNAAGYIGCATHDFCDANEVMISAFESAMGRPLFPADESDVRESDFDLTEAAWNAARESGFALNGAMSGEV